MGSIKAHTSPAQLTKDTLSSHRPSTSKKKLIPPLCLFLSVLVIIKISPSNKRKHEFAGPHAPYVPAGISGPLHHTPILHSRVYVDIFTCHPLILHFTFQLIHLTRATTNFPNKRSPQPIQHIHASNRRGSQWLELLKTYCVHCGAHRQYEAIFQASDVLTATKNITKVQSQHYLGISQGPNGAK